MKIFSYRKLDEALSDPRVRASGIAQVAGINITTLRSLRLGLKKPKINTLVAIAQALNKPIDYFLEEEAIVQQQTLPLGNKGVVNA